ncbi:hypothetical protein MKW92_005150 [Papaver armeniacum]|nr:hypothetical protein MKW92_005150 [Papaver armeniacum]
MEDDETELRREEVKHHVAILSPAKHGTTVYNAVYKKCRVIVVEEDNNTVVEKSVKQDHVLRFEGDFRDGKCSIYESYACTLKQFIDLKRRGYDIRNIRCTREERVVLMRTLLLDSTPSVPNI